MSTLLDNIFTVIGIILGGSTIVYFLYLHLLRPVHRMVMAAGTLIERELTPNGGGSLIDKVNRIEAKMDVHMKDSTVHNISTAAATHDD